MKVWFEILQNTEISHMKQPEVELCQMFMLDYNFYEEGD